MVFLSLPPFSYAQGDFPLEIGTSINPVGSGARAMGQGNAFIAVADDATAASWNPAGLLQLENPEISFAVEAVWFDQRLFSSSNPEASGNNGLDLADLNYASLVIPFFFHTNMVISLNYLTLYRFDKAIDFPIDFLATTPFELSQQQSIDFDQEGAFSALIPAFGIDITDKLSIGVAFNIWSDAITGNSSFDKRQRSNGNFFSPDDGRVINTFDEVFKENLIVEEGYSLAIGSMYRINENWNLGVVIKPPFHLDIDREITVEKTSQEGVLFAKKDSKLEFP